MSDLTSTDKLNVLVVGSGGREHALVWALANSPSVASVFAAPGNDGMAALASLVPIPATDVAGIAAWAAAHGVDLVVIGPDAAVAAGLADALQVAGVPVFGPTRAASELEWSKVFAKAFMARHGIPTAACGACDTLDDALAFVAEAPWPMVVKADGLAAGKGVLICRTRAEAADAVRSIMQDRVFGDAGTQVVIEEFLEGEELSVFALVDGERYALLPLARDYKCLLDGNLGPNTGGMGSFAPVPDVPAELLDQIRTQVLEPTIAGMRAEGRPYQGVLYTGFMLTPSGPRVLEYNCRFGDPETQVLLPLIAGDVAQLLRQCALGQLAADVVPVRDAAAVCVVLASDGYPERPRAGDPIEGVDRAEARGALVFQAGVARHDGQLVTSGGRVLATVGVAENVAAARELAYDAANDI
ncbi:MAG: phosphoribosylamine--glycine ligase, partial [Thermomicrobiales bacterium]|nr:phosphoribosylamine--glycine ligase [Thermomicrobiales bacterium]